MRLFKRLAVVMAGVMAAVVLSAIPANAAWACPPQLVCFYWLSGGVGYQYNFSVTMPANGSDIEIYVGEPVRSNAHSVKNNYVNRVITRRYASTACSYEYQSVYIPYQGGHNFNPYTTCFRMEWA